MAYNKSKRHPQKENMMEMGLFLIFWYGMLHAFGPDHLTAIADFSIGKEWKRTMSITLLFAFGHGVTLFLFAKMLDYSKAATYLADHGDLISSLVIAGMGLYLLMMVLTDRIQFSRHFHEGKAHTHIWFGKSHSHDDKTLGSSVLGMGAVMGMGGVRGMLVTLGMLHGEPVDLNIVFAFVMGVSVVFLSFGLVMLYLNSHLLSSKRDVRRVFAAAGLVSVAVGTNMLF